MCVVLLHFRSMEDGGLWSLTLENYIHTNKLAVTHNPTVRKLYGSADRYNSLFIIPLKAVIFPLVPSCSVLILVCVWSVCCQCLRAN